MRAAFLASGLATVALHAEPLLASAVALQEGLVAIVDAAHCARITFFVALVAERHVTEAACVESDAYRATRATMCETRVARHTPELEACAISPSAALACASAQGHQPDWFECPSKTTGDDTGGRGLGVGFVRVCLTSGRRSKRKISRLLPSPLSSPRPRPSKT